MPPFVVRILYFFSLASYLPITALRKWMGNVGQRNGFILVNGNARIVDAYMHCRENREKNDKIITAIDSNDINRIQSYKWGHPLYKDRKMYLHKKIMFTCISLSYLYFMSLWYLRKKVRLVRLSEQLEQWDQREQRLDQVQSR